MSRRIAAIVLPHLLSEWVLDKKKLPPKTVLGVIFDTERPSSKDKLAAVTPAAHRLGVRPGQTAAEAHASAAQLRIERVTREDLEQELAGVLDIAARYGSLAGYAREGRAPDTVWVDVTGSAELFGGEAALALEIQERVRQLGHASRVVIASGPLVARALGSLGPITPSGTRVVEEHELAMALGELPLAALPLEDDKILWFSRIGILTIAQMLALPAAETAARLGRSASRLLELARGRDSTPLVAVLPPRELDASQEWEDPVEGSSVVLFAARGLLAKMSARLEARGEAACRLDLTLHLEGGGRLPFLFPLAVPLWRAADLERIVQHRVERLELTRAVTGISLRLLELTPSRVHQLCMGDPSQADEDREFPLLVAELEVEFGADRLGRLSVTDGHRPEQRSTLVPWTERAPKKRADSSARLHKELDRATRLFTPPAPLPEDFGLGCRFAWGLQLFTVERMEGAERLESVEWWTASSTSRDYYWAWLRGEKQSGENLTTEALVYFDRKSKAFFLQAWAD